ncbi:SAM-dependent methyltransferase [Aureimonas ureilytica]|uniref:SAM-dependent methyltransferase n=1 Tax=Aureimonas ureilytica TaxID=401562 RepID=A0A175RWZ0_9HYPH|nr:methyltransferase domain-containing protein [Aureimonas ureilytica]KTR08057.1 SAM-dependent methyltransferase [Aureimonas ureilytica]
MTEAPAPFDRALLGQRRLRAHAKAEPGADFLLQNVAEDLVDRLSLVQRRFAMGVDLAGYSGQLASRLAAGGQVDRILRIERDEKLLGHGSEIVVADEEMLPLADESVDLVISALSLHLTNDTPGAFVQVRRALKPDGLFLAALLGGDTLNELRASLLAAEAELSGGASPRVAPFADMRDIGSLLQRTGFALPVIDLDRLTVRYDTIFHLMRDLRAMGMTNMLDARSRRPATRRLFLRAGEIYAERFADPDGRLRATFDIVYVSGWRPHDSQQKPLKPGSAKMSLAEALKPKPDA